MEIKITKFNPNGVFNRSHRKEDKYTGGYKVLRYNSKKKSIDTVIDLRFYWTTQTCYCVVWYGSKNGMVSGSGSAGGWGYHKESASACLALASTGIEFGKCYWGGAGSSAIESALKALASKLGYRKVTIINNHG